MSWLAIVQLVLTLIPAVESIFSTITGAVNTGPAKKAAVTGVVQQAMSAAQEVATAIQPSNTALWTELEAPVSALIDSIVGVMNAAPSTPATTPAPTSATTGTTGSEPGNIL